MTVEEIQKEIDNLSSEDKGKLTDGYHTFSELYDHRIALYILLARKLHTDYTVWKSIYHSDGSGYEGWFILGIKDHPGYQITYHLPIKYWNKCDFAIHVSKAPQWDGHTSKDVLKRLEEIIW